MTADWDDVRVLLAVVETGSLSAAARRLGLSQATVGRKLRSLEASAGGALFDRLANSLSLTERGQALLPAAQAMGLAAEGLARALHAQARPAQPLVRISATSSVSLFLAARLDELQVMAPAICIEILTSREQSNLARREADIALRMRRLPEAGNLLARRVGLMRFGLYASRAYSDTDPPRLIGLPDPGRPSRQYDWMQAQPGTIIARLGDVAARHQAIKTSLGIGLLPCWLGDADPNLRPMPPAADALDETIYLLLHSDMKASPAIRVVADALAALFNAL